MNTSVSGQEFLGNIKNINNNTKDIDITAYGINTKNFDNGLSNLIIAQISDLHINYWNIDLLKKTVEIINKIKPDIVTVTGDAICNGKKFMPDLVKIFGNINANYGKFACLGNHDHSDGDDGNHMQEVYRKSDFNVLINQAAKVAIKGENLYIAGADDIELGDQNIEKMVKELPKEATSVFLTHNPRNFADFAVYRPELVLSGHTHGCQMFSSFLRLLHKYVLKLHYIAGMYEEEKSTLYVNRGIGTALVSPEIFNKKYLINTPRINSKPEISFFVLNPTV